MSTRMTQIRRRYVEQHSQYGILLCGLCGFGIAHADEITVDHILPKSLGGSGKQSNLQPAHKKCNELKGNGKLVTWLDPHKEKNDEQKPRTSDTTHDTARVYLSHIASDTFENPTVTVRDNPRGSRRRSFAFRQAARDRERRRFAADSDT